MYEGSVLVDIVCCMSTERGLVLASFHNASLIAYVHVLWHLLTELLKMLSSFYC